MARPGVTVTTRDAPPASGPPIRTGTAFVIGLAQSGSVIAPVKVESLVDFEREFGARQSYSYLYDALDVFFREGGGSAYVSRVVGNGAVASSVTLNASTGPTIVVAAKSPGTYAEDWTATVTVSGGTTTLTIKDGAGATLESYATPSTGSKAAFLAYTGWQYIAITDADPADGDPIAVTNAGFAGGVDDIGGVTDSDYFEALDRIPAALGPGQVAAPGVTDTDVQAAVLAHAEANNRVAILDTPNTGVVATLTAHATTMRATGRGDYGMLLGSWVKVPGVGGTAALRTVPGSAVQMGLEARRDRLESQNVPAAGRSYPYSYVSALVREFSDPDRTTLINAGVVVAKTVGSVFETYGYRSLASTATDPNWVQFNFARLRMAIAARAEDIGESFLFEQIDGKGLKLAEFGSAISGMLLDFYLAGSLYGESPDDAFRVDVGSSVNTAETIAAGELHAVAAVRMSPHAEMVVIEFVKTPITQSVG